MCLYVHAMCGVCAFVIYEPEGHIWGTGHPPPKRRLQQSSKSNNNNNNAEPKLFICPQEKLQDLSSKVKE